MGFAEDLAQHAERIRARMPHVAGEEATKHSLIVPLLQVLGWDVFDPLEIRPEFNADFATKKAGQLEKIDYAICRDGQPLIFVEAKALGQALQDHSGQLSRYFNATPSVRVAIITDGVKVRVFTDLRAPNIMDSEPWLDIDLLAIDHAQTEALKRFRKVDFSPDDIVALAEEMVYYDKMVAFLGAQLRDPSDSLVRYVAGEMGVTSRLTQRMVDRLKPTLRKALRTVIVEHISKSFEPAPSPSETPPRPAPAPAAAPPTVSAAAPTTTTGPGEPRPQRAGVVTTVEELATYDVIAAWIRELRPDAPIAYRDSKSCFAVHMDNTRKWFARFNVQTNPQWVSVRHVTVDELRMLAPGLPVSDGGWLGTRADIASAADLPKLRAAVIAAYQRESVRVADASEPVDPEAN